MKINKEVYALNITSELGITKEDIFLTVLKDKNSMVLIDTGYPGLYQNIHSAFQKDNLDITNLETIILSHQDIDHIGSAKLLKEQSQNKIKILSHEQEADYISGEKTPLKLITFEKKLKYMKEPEKADKIYKGMKRGYEMCYLNVDKTLKDNEVLPICGGVTILHTPGHTHGHICLYLNKYKILISGDTIGLKDGKLKLTDDMYNYDSEENKNSIKKLLNYDIQKIICYHGGIFEGDTKKELESLL